MAQINTYDHRMVSAQAYPEQHATYFSGAAEWYLTACLCFLLLQGVFLTFIGDITSSEGYIIRRVTGYAIAPSELYFLTIGAVVGLVIYLVGRGRLRGHILGSLGFMGYWLVHLLAVVNGVLHGTPFWHVDFRWMLLPTIVVPWVAILASNVRYDVVLSRYIKLAVPLAVINASRGLSFIDEGAKIVGSKEEAWNIGINYQADLVLLLAYVLALSRLFTGRVQSTLSVVILAAGVVLPMSKIAIAAFLFANFGTFLLAVWLGFRQEGMRIGKIMLAAFIVGIGLSAVSAILLMANRGAGMTFLKQRIFKVNQSSYKRDISTGRLIIWKKALRQFSEDPLIGKGLGSRVYRYRRGSTGYLPYHSYYLRYLAQMGLFGFLVIMGVFLAWSRRALRALKWESPEGRLWPRLGLIMYVFAIAFSGFYTEALASTTISYLFWMILAMETTAHSQLLTTPSASPLVYGYPLQESYHYHGT